MIEQSTIRDGIHLASEWGWLGTAIVLYILGQVAYTVYSNIIVKRRAFDPLSRMFQELEKRTTYEWVEKQLNKYQTKDVADAHLRGVETRLVHIETLLREINGKIK